MTGWDRWQREILGTRGTASYLPAPLLCIWECSLVSLTQVVTLDRETEAVPIRMAVSEVRGLQGQPAAESCLLAPLLPASFPPGP